MRQVALLFTRGINDSASGDGFDISGLTHVIRRTSRREPVEVVLIALFELLDGEHGRAFAFTCSFSSERLTLDVDDDILDFASPIGDGPVRAPVRAGNPVWPVTFALEIGHLEDGLMRFNLYANRQLAASTLLGLLTTRASEERSERA